MANFLKSSKVRYRTAQSFLFNGVIYLSSILLVEYTVFPLIRSLVGSLSGQEAGWLGLVVEGLTSMFYHIFWLLPLYVISLILNMTTVAEVAEDTFKVIGLPYDKSSSLSSVVSDILFESLFLTACMTVAAGVDILVVLSPYVSEILLVFTLLVSCIGRGYTHFVRLIQSGNFRASGSYGESEQ